MVTLVIVPTAGNFNLRLSNGLLTPTHAGELRLDKAAQLLLANPGWKLAIVGGNRKNPDETEAEIYHQYFWKHYPQLGDRTLLVLDKHKCTVHDMVDLAEELKAMASDMQAFDIGETIEMVIVTHPDHCRIARIPLRTLIQTAEVRCEPSGEERPYSPKMQAILLWVTQHDPLWRGFWSWPFRALASRRENPPFKQFKPTPT